MDAQVQEAGRAFNVGELRLSALLRVMERSGRAAEVDKTLLDVMLRPYLPDAQECEALRPRFAKIMRESLKTFVRAVDVRLQHGPEATSDATMSRGDILGSAITEFMRAATPEQRAVVNMFLTTGSYVPNTLTHSGWPNGRVPSYSVEGLVAASKVIANTANISFGASIMISRAKRFIEGATGVLTRSQDRGRVGRGLAASFTPRLYAVNIA